MLLGKRAQIRASTLMSRSPEYKSKLVAEFWKSHKNDFAENAIFPVVDSVYSIRDISEAQRYMATNQNCGKIILNNEF